MPISSSPNSKNMNEKACSSAAPKTMKITRGTANVLMMITKTKRLSTDRLFSTMYPAKYCPPNSQPAIEPKTTPKPIATAT